MRPAPLSLFDFVLIPRLPAINQQSHPDLTRLLFVFSLFFLLPSSVSLLVPESLWIFLIKLPRFLPLPFTLYLVFLRVSTQGKFQRRAFAIFLKALPIRSLSRSPSQGMYTFLFLQRASASAGDSLNFTSLFEFSRVFFRAFPRSHFLLSSLRFLLSSSISAHLTHSDLTFKIDPSLRSRRSVLIPQQRSAYLLLFGTRLNF